LDLDKLLQLILLEMDYIKLFIWRLRRKLEPAPRKPR